MVSRSLSTRRFIVRFHSPIPEEKINLNNLPGHGRLDVLCRTITASFFLANSFRIDSELYIIFSNNQYLKLVGNELRGLNPDERSIGGALRKVLSGKGFPGIFLFQGTLKKLAERFPESVVLSPQGELSKNYNLPWKTFFLGDHMGWIENDEKVLKKLPKISLGPFEYLTSSCITLLHQGLDIQQMNQEGFSNSK